MFDAEVEDYVFILEEGLDNIANGLWLKAYVPYRVIAKSINGQLMISHKDSGHKTTILNKEKQYLGLVF